MASQKGIVVKINGSSCIVVTREGVYKKIKTLDQGIIVGSEITLQERNWRRFVKPVSLVASLFILVLALSMFKNLLTPEPRFFVSLDINPSLELIVDSSLNVTGVKTYNSDGNKVSEKLKLQNKDLNEAIKLLLREATRQQYLAAGKESLILATVCGEPGATQDRIASDLTASLTQVAVQEKVRTSSIVYRLNRSFHDTSTAQGVTAGKYLLYLQAQSELGSVSLSDIRSQNVGQILFAYGLNLLPNDTVIALSLSDTTPGVTTLEELLNRTRTRTKTTTNQKGSLNEQGSPPTEGTESNEETPLGSNKTHSTNSGNTSSGNTSSGNSSSGNTSSGSNTGSGNPDSGNPDSGNPDSGNTDSGNPDSGNPDSGNTSSGNTDSGNTSSGNTSSGNTGSGNTGSGNTGSGNTSSGNTDSGNTGSGNTDSGNTGSGNTGSGNTGSGGDSAGSGGSGGGSTGDSGGGSSGGSGGGSGGAGSGSGRR